MNRLYPKAKHPEAMTRRIIRCFARDWPVARTARAVGLEKRQIIQIFGQLRARLAKHAGALQQKHRQSEEWAEADQWFLETVRNEILVQRLGLARALDPRTIQAFTAGDTKLGGDAQKARFFKALEKNPRVPQLREWLASHHDEFREIIFKQAKKNFGQITDEYFLYRMRKRRGLHGAKKSAYRQESNYRCTLLLMKNREYIYRKKPTFAKMDDGRTTFRYEASPLEMLMRRDHTIYAVVEQDLLTILEKDPL